MRVILIAVVLEPGRPIGWGSAIIPGHGPRTGQGVIDRRNLVVQDVRVILVQIDALLEDGLVVGVAGNAGLVEEARALEVAGHDLLHVGYTLAVLVDPLTAQLPPI